MIYCCCFSQGHTQTELQFINDYPIKLDGGCSFYTFDSTSIDLNRFIFIVSAKKVGFISVNNHYIYLKSTKNVKVADKKFITYFSGEGYDIILNVTKVNKIDDNNSLYAGFMDIKYKNSIQKFKIHGKVGEF
jgi:hypothetical protein